MNAFQQADKQGVRLLALASMPNDPHLELVLCECGGVQPYVTWFHNTECGGFHEGIYCATLAEAIAEFDKRAKRYEAKRIPLVPEKLLDRPKFRVNPEQPEAAYCRLDDQHELIITRTDEGVVLDSWKDGEDEDGPVWSTYHYTNEMVPEDE